MKWGTLLLIIIAIVSVVGIAIFMVPWEDVGTSFHCGDTSYAFEQHVNVRAWYDPSETYMQRRIVHEPGNPLPFFVQAEKTTLGGPDVECIVSFSLP